ncbi:ABC transporter substrate-binding protein [Desulfatiglans anilini]|uniref:ABC transporter substrate-binding protein n=1 Tax=Desulfatiglans anilini TaxID=90728 RepID=UPI001FC9B47D|nr:ABC transporter substrate-binding protein [Desulfatiglans anilini]
MGRRKMPFLLLAALLWALPAWAGKPAPLKKAAFIPQWVPQAQFAGYYMALEKGFYQAHGIDLTIISGGPANPPADCLTSGQAQFATLWLCTGLEMRDRGIPVVNIAQMVQRSALMLVAKKSSGIRTIQDLQGKKVGVWGPIFQLQPRALFKKLGLDVQFTRQSYSVNLFLRDGVDAASAMWYNEYHTIINAGLNPDELVPFFFHEYGLNFPEDGIYVLEPTLQEDPALCCAFMKASIKGWLYAFDHVEETLDLVMKNLKEAHIPATRVHQKWMLERMRDLMRPASGAWSETGLLLRADYLRVAEMMQKEGFIDAVPEFTSFHKDCTPDAAP